MLVYMIKKTTAPDALREGSEKMELFVAVEKHIHKQRAFHTRVTNLFRTMACGVDRLDSRVEKRFDRLEEKLDALLERS
jgi:hypothetical protein